MKPVVLSVSQVNAYVRSLLEGDGVLGGLFLQGEISNFTNHVRTGHFYFTLKDEAAAIKAVMFKAQAARLRFTPSDGMRVICRGRVSLYEAAGTYQFYAEDMQPDGVGALTVAYEQLAAKLRAEGLFDDARKKPLPAFPERMAVITSPTGAAVQDILNISARRFPLCEIVLCPVQVQGASAAPQMVAALEEVNRSRCADVVLIGRGGGSIEDLWAFNEEPLARAVAASAIPVVSAVGHETDYTLCDFAADLRAPTPSAAAELTLPDCGEVLRAVRGAREVLLADMRRALQNKQIALTDLLARGVFAEPMSLLRTKEVELYSLQYRLCKFAEEAAAARQAALASLAANLDALSPLKVLARGYAIVNKDGCTVRTVRELTCGARYALRFADGQARCFIEDIAL